MLGTTAELANGNWRHILSTLGGIPETTFSGRHQSCPMCGGTDRFRYDDKTGAGDYYCNQCGAGDGFSMLQKLTGRTFAQCASDVDALLSCPMPEKKAIAKKEKLEAIFPMPDEAVASIESRNFSAYNPKTGKRWNISAELSSIYCTAAGVAVGAVVRVIVDGKKITPQVIFTREHGITLGAMPEPRPLLFSEQLRAGFPVLLVEGEKCAHAAMEMLCDRYDVVTWAGGSKATAKSDFSALRGRAVAIWPDNDDEGRGAAQKIAGMIEGARIIGIPDGKSKGWDVADAIAEGANVDDLCAIIESRGVAHYSDSANFTAWRDLGEKGKPLSTFENFRSMLDHYGIYLRYNAIKKKTEAAIPGLVASIDNMDNVAIAHIRSIAARNNYPVGDVLHYMNALSDLNCFNPVANWITSKPWDGVDRLTDFCNCIPSSNPELTAKLIRKWLIGAAMLACKAEPEALHGILVIHGPQGSGKTSFVKSLMPFGDYILTGATLDPQSKDSVTTAISHWIVELGELGSTMRRADVDRLKAFITNSRDTLRRPYLPVDSQYQRRTAFIASVNDRQFLRDGTGNRRFWVVDNTGKINWDNGIDRQQIFAQAWESYQSGERCWLDETEQAELERSNAAHVESCPIAELIGSRLDWEAHKSAWVEMTTTELLISLGRDKPTMGDVRAANAALDAMGSAHRRTATHRLRVVPPKVSDKVPEWL